LSRRRGTSSAVRRPIRRLRAPNSWSGSAPGGPRPACRGPLPRRAGTAQKAKKKEPPEAAESGAGGGIRPPGVRLDVWLHVACLYPTRSRAKAACEGGKVDVAGGRARPHREVRPGDSIEITTPSGTRRSLVVRGLASRSIPKAEARELYEDVTPPPTAEQLEVRRLERILAPSRTAGRPDRRERREGRKRKGWDGS